jgi:hypothetical protein
LVELDLSRTWLQAGGLKSLAAIVASAPRMERLKLSQVWGIPRDLDGLSIDAATGERALGTLRDLRDHGASYVGHIVALLRAVPRSFVELDLRGNAIDDVAVVPLREALAKPGAVPPGVQVLLEGNLIGGILKGDDARMVL